jgi:hypothetical protein
MRIEENKVVEADWAPKQVKKLLSQSCNREPGGPKS